MFVEFIEVQSLTHVGEECNKYDKITAPHFLLVNHNDWSKCFAITYLRPICNPSVSLWVGLEKKKLNLDMKNIFARSHI